MYDPASRRTLTHRTTRDKSQQIARLAHFHAYNTRMLQSRLQWMYPIQVAKLLLTTVTSKDERIRWKQDKCLRVYIHLGLKYNAAASMDCGLEASSRYPTHDSFAALVDRLTALTNYAQ